MSGWKNRTLRTLSRLMRLAVMFAMQPDANFTRALAMSTLRRQHRHADGLDARRPPCRSIARMISRS